MKGYHKKESVVDVRMVFARFCIYLCLVLVPVFQSLVWANYEELEVSADEEKRTLRGIYQAEEIRKKEKWEELMEAEAKQWGTLTQKTTERAQSVEAIPKQGMENLVLQRKHLNLTIGISGENVLLKRDFAIYERIFTLLGIETVGYYSQSKLSGVKDRKTMKILEAKEVILRKHQRTYANSGHASLFLCFALGKCNRDMSFRNRFDGLKETLWSKNSFCQTLQKFLATDEFLRTTFPCFVLPVDRFMLLEYVREKLDGELIIKPYKQGGGKGIKLINFENGYFDDYNYFRNKYVVQEYLQKSHKYKGIKYDLRVYVVMYWEQERLRAKLFNRGLVRLAKSKSAYLTNTSVRKGEDMVDATLSFRQLEKFINEDEPDRSFTLQEAVAPPLRSLIKATEAAFHERKKNISSSYHVLGVDIILNQALEAKLIEVNGEPSMKLSKESILRPIDSFLQHTSSNTLEVAANHYDHTKLLLAYYKRGNPRPRVPRPRSARGAETPESPSGRGRVGSAPETPSRVVQEVPPEVGPKAEEDFRGGRAPDPGSPLGSITADEFLASMMDQFKKLNMASSVQLPVGRGNMDSRGGFRPPKIQKLDALDRDKLGDFVLRMEKMRRRAGATGADISVTDWMSIHILELVEAQEVDINNYDAIMDYLKFHLEVLNKLHQSQALGKLRGELNWPNDAFTGKEALERCTQKARDLVGTARVSNRTVQKQMLRILVEKLPPYFAMSYADFKEENPEVRTLDEFSKAMENYTAVESIKIRESRKRKSMSRKLSDRNVEARIAELSRKIEELERRNRRSEQPQRRTGGDGKRRVQ
eukprot:augustus_masked-scaffold_8-processed-gene-5.65-mRNA-1 protein AED:1.00 eAED:1.00 QI:0/0/0/0/1/1/2/0/816